MAFRTTPAPYVRGKNSTPRIMAILSIALLVVYVAGIITNGVLLGASYGLRAFLLLVVALATTAVCDALTTIIRFKKDGKQTLLEKIWYDLKYNYSYVTAIIFVLTLPVWTSYYVVIIGSAFATVVVKNLFGGFGKNIFNPATMARIFVGVCFASALAPTFSANAQGLVTSYSNLDAVASSTVTTVMKNSYGWVCDTAYFGGISTWDLLLGNYIGSIGETFTLLIFVIGIVLIVLEVINWRTPVFYLGTVILSSLVIGLATGMENPFTYVLYSVALGSTMFGAVFMITDPVTGPTSNLGKSIVGVIAGLLTTLVRIKTKNAEGVALSIAFCNLISPAIDYFCTSKSNEKLPIKYAVVFGLMALAIGINTGAGIEETKNITKYTNGLSTTEIEKVTNSEFVLKEGHSLKANDGSGNAYYIIDENGSVVAEIYYEHYAVDIEMMGVTENQDVKLLVGVNVADGSIYDIGYISDPGINEMFIHFIKASIDDIDNIGSFNADAFSGTSYSKVALTYIFTNVADEFYENHPELKGGNK